MCKEVRELIVDEVCEKLHKTMRSSQQQQQAAAMCVRKYFHHQIQRSRPPLPHSAPHAPVGCRLCQFEDEQPAVVRTQFEKMKLGGPSCSSSSSSSSACSSATSAMIIM